MEYQLTKIAKTHYRGHGEVVSTVLAIARSTGLPYVQPLFSSLVPRPTPECSACGRCYVWHGQHYPWFWQRGCQVMCALIGTSLSLLRLTMDQHLDEASYMQPAMSACWWIRSEFAPGSSESNLGHDSEGSAHATCEQATSSAVVSQTVIVEAIVETALTTSPRPQW